MRLFICGWRPWSILGRYKSLIENARKMGHEVWGVASDHLGVAKLTWACFEQLGITPSKGSEVRQNLDEWQPDAVFGEQYWNCPEELAGRYWAYENHKRHLVLDHAQNYMPDDLTRPDAVLDHHKQLDSRSTLLTGTQALHDRLEGVTGAKRVLVGMPQYDLAVQPVDTEAVREKLGVGPGQKLVAMSLSHDDDKGRPYFGEAEMLMPLLELADRRGWKIVCSPHPMERVKPDELKWPNRAGYLCSMQDEGVQFVSDFPPGVAEGVEFLQVPLYELLAAADGVTGSSHTMVFPAYVMRKPYFPFTYDYFYCTSNMQTLDENFGNLIHAVEIGDRWPRQAGETRRYFWKLDGLAWQRMLEEAIGGSGSGA